MKIHKLILLGVTPFIAPALSICTSCNKDTSKITLTELGNEVNMHNRVVDEFLVNPIESRVVFDGSTERSIPDPVKLSWKETSNINNTDPYVIAVSEDKDLSNPWIFETYDTSYNLYNCKINTPYYWQVSHGSLKSNISSFKSKECKIRMLKIDGVTNCRDLGGWKTSEGKEIKQGVMFRTGRYNESDREGQTFNIEITDAGQKQLRDQLGVKTEIDLRRDDIERCMWDEATQTYKTNVVPGVGYKWMAMEHAVGRTLDDNLLISNKNAITTMFNEVFPNEANYPLSFHCNIGTDRTGSIAYALLALCGVSKEDMIADYLVSNYGKILGGHRRFSDLENGYPLMLEQGQGETLMERTASVLKTKFGVTEANIAKIRHILIKE